MNYPANELEIDYTTNLFTLNNIDIANHISQMMLGNHIIYKNRFYVWNGNIWEQEALGYYLFTYISRNGVYNMYRSIELYQMANGHNIPKSISKKIQYIGRPTRADRIARELMKCENLKFHGEFNANKDLVVYPDGLWDKSIGGYIENSKNYYINKQSFNEQNMED
jgi:hypothetical protein